VYKQAVEIGNWKCVAGESRWVDLNWVSGWTMSIELLQDNSSLKWTPNEFESFTMPRMNATEKQSMKLNPYPADISDKYLESGK
jgi:hypothetical protein